jgi:hypothetical protein
VLLNSYGKHTRVADARRIRRWMESSEHIRVLPDARPASASETAATT